MEPYTPPGGFTTLLGALDQAATTERGYIFIDTDGPSAGGEIALSYRDCRDRAARLASVLQGALGRPAGQPVLWVMSNSDSLVLGFFASLHAGYVPAIMAPIRPFADPEEWARKLATVSRSADDAPLIAPAFLAGILRNTRAGAGLTVLDVEPLIEAEPAAPSAPRPALGGEDIACLQFTSGSLGDPKGVTLTHAAAIANAALMIQRTHITAADRYFLWVPLVHDMALVSMFSGVLVGVDQIFQPTEAFAVNPARWLIEMAERGCTSTAAPPFAFAKAQRRLERAGLKPDLSRLRICVVGAEPIDASILRRFSEGLLGGYQPFSPSYGIAEMTCAVAAPPPGEPLVTFHADPDLRVGQAVSFVPADSPGAIEVTSNGHPLPGTEIRIVDSLDAPLPDGYFGRIECRGPSLMKGYWRRPDATASAMHPDPSGPWLRTGDLGFLKDGQIIIAGREKDVIIIRGRHYFPEEIDALVQTVPNVRPRGVLTFGEPDPSGGPERVTIVLEADRKVDAAAREALSRAVREVVADRMDLAVSQVHFVPPGNLPRTSSGKPRRGVARERWGQRANAE